MFKRIAKVKFFMKKPFITFLLAVFILEFAVVFFGPLKVLAQDTVVQSDNLAEAKKLNAQGLEQELKTFQSLLDSRDKKALSSQYQNIQTSYQKVIADLAATKTFLEQTNAAPVVIQRLEKFKADYQAKISQALATIDISLKKSKTSSSDYSKLSKTIDGLLANAQLSAAPENPRPFQTTADGQVIKKKESSLKPSFLNSVISTISKIGLGKSVEQASGVLSKINSQPIQPGLLQTASIPAEYLAPAGEIEFSQSIKDLADSLAKDPLNILNFVKNNIDYVPYYGVKKGADAALIERAGNDFDQSALLIALLRYSGYPAKYQRGQIKLSLSQAMNLLGVDDPIVAAKMFSKTHIPYILYTDANDAPLFFTIEHAWVQTYITYDYTQGIAQNANEADKMWVPMEPSLKSIYSSQVEDVVDEMGFNVASFYEAYLQGAYGAQKPMQAFRAQIESYLTAHYPDLVYDDILTKRYRQSEKLEFIPNTLPYEIIENTAEYAQAPEGLKHKIQFRITEQTQGTELLNCTTTLAELADKQLAITYTPASPADQQVIDSFGDIYNVVPLSLVHIKPVVKAQGVIKCGGAAGAPEIVLGKKQNLTMTFSTPGQTNGQLATLTEDTIQKEVIAGNDEGVAINTDRIILPETRPQQDTQTTEFASSQKLYRTALNYLGRLQESHNELAQVLGGEFTNEATRAIVFNGIDISYQASQPYSFTWKGLRIDSSSKVNYFSHFGSDIKKNQTRFMHLFGLQGSLNESSIFEEDYNIEAMSTVKGLKMINQGQIPGRTMLKITSANRNAINALTISEALKTKFRASLDNGNTIYTPNQQFTYQNWTGLVYIDLNPNNGDAGYIIGEGLNGGYTVGEWSLWWKTLWKLRVLTNITAAFIAPTENQEFNRGDKIGTIIRYSGVIGSQPNTWTNTWTEMGTVDSNFMAAGIRELRAAYGIDTAVKLRMKGKSLGTIHNEYDNIIFKEALEFGIDPDLLKSLIQQESLSFEGGAHFHAEAYRYEPCIDYMYFSGSSPAIGLTNEPYSHFVIPQGDKIASLDPSYQKIVKDGALIANQALKFSATSTNLTLAKLWEDNVAIQNWDDVILASPTSSKCRDLLIKANRNFTVQFLLPGSYGLTQILYPTAVEEVGFNTDKPNRSPSELFKPEIGIHYGAKYLKQVHDNLPISIRTWRNAILRYNGSESYAKEVYDKLYLSNLYDIINY